MAAEKESEILHELSSWGKGKFFEEREVRQVRERLSGRLPLLVIKDTEKNRQIAGFWRIPGTSVRVSPEGDIFYPVWRERVRINKPELYLPCSSLPRGWTLERLLASRRRPISEIIFYQVKKDGGSVEAAIRSMDHILERYSQEEREVKQVLAIRNQVARARQVLMETKGVSKEEFEEGFEILYRQTLALMEEWGLNRAALSLKKDIARLLERASTGRNGLERRNPLAVLKRLEAAEKRIEYRVSEMGFVRDKFLVNRAGLLAQREKDRRILTEVLHQFTSGLAGHEAFKKGETTSLQRGILLGMAGNLIYKLEQVRVKPYKPAAVEIIKQVWRLQEIIKSGNYQEAKEIFVQASERTKKILNEFTLSQGLCL